MIDLRVGKLRAIPRAAAVDRHADTAVVRDNHPIRIRRVDPDVVKIAERRGAERVAAGRRRIAAQRSQRCAAVERPAERRGQEIHVVLVVGLDRHAEVIVGPATDVVARRHHPPVLAAIVGPPELTGRGGPPFPRLAGARLEQRVDAIRIALRDGDADLANFLIRQTVTGEALPRRAAIDRFEQSTAGSAALLSPRMDHELPHSREEHVWMFRIHRDVGAAGVLVHEQHFFPRFAAVFRPEHAAIGLRPVAESERRGEHDVRVARIDHHAPDAAGLLQPHQRPALAGVDRFVNTGARRDVTADPCFARARPDDVRIARRHGQRSDRRDRLSVENRLPRRAGIARLEDAARCSARVVDLRIARNAGHRRHAVAHGTDVAELHLSVRTWRPRSTRLGRLRLSALSADRWRHAACEHGDARRQDDEEQRLPDTHMDSAR